MRVAAGVAELAQLALQPAPGQLRKRRKPLAQIALERARPCSPAADAGHRPAAPGRARCICAPSCGRARPGGRSPRRSRPADAVPGSSRSPQVRPMTRPSAWKGTIIGQPPPTARQHALLVSSPGENSIGTFGEYSAGAHKALHSAYSLGGHVDASGRALGVAAQDISSALPVATHAPGCGGRRGALFDKYPHAGRCSKHIKKLIPAGLWHRFAWPAFRRQSFVPVIASEVGTNS